MFFIKFCCWDPTGTLGRRGLKLGSAEGAGGKTASGAQRPMCDAHANEAAAEFDLKLAGKGKKKQQSCIRKTHFIGNHDLRE